MEENYPYEDGLLDEFSDFYISQLEPEPEPEILAPPLLMPNISVTNVVQELTTNVADFAAHTGYYAGYLAYDTYQELIELGGLIRDNINEIIRLNML